MKTLRFLLLATLIMGIVSSANTAGPNTNVDILATPLTVPVGGGTINLEVSETNTGDIPLYFVFVDIFKGDELISFLEFPPDDDSGNGDNKLDPGEIWSWILLNIPVTEPTLFTGIGKGLDPYQGYGEVTCPDYPDECDEVFVDIDGTGNQSPVAQICECGQNEYDLNEDIPLDGTCSNHPDPKRNIVLYEWDFDNDGVYDATGPTTTITGGFPSKACWPVTLRVTDDNPADLGGPQTGTHTCQIFVHPPCLDPRADAGGPYDACVGVAVTLDASGSTGNISLYEWDFDNDGVFDASTNFSMLPYLFATEGGYDVRIRVSDLDSPELYDEDTTTVTVTQCVIDVDVDIYPNRVPNRVFLSRNYTLYVVIMGSVILDVTTVNNSTVRFGKTGTQASPVRAPLLHDFNGDGLVDALYGFKTFDCDFALGDTQGVLRGELNDGTDIVGSDSALIYP